MEVGLLRLFEAKALAAELRKRHYQVSDRTVQRWKAGITQPKPQDMTAIRALLTEQGIEENPPAWAEGLADRTARRVIEALVDPEVLAALPHAIAALEALPPPPADSPLVNDERQDQAESKR